MGTLLKQFMMGVGGGQSWSSYWATRGVEPGADATLVTTEINTALQNFSYVKITEPGIYDIDGTLYIPSNTTLEFVAGCTIRKKTGTTISHMIANEGMLTGTTDTNVTLIGNGLNCDINGIDGSNQPIPGLRGHLSFYRVTNFNVSGIKTDTNNIAQYFFQISEFTNATLRNINVAGWKDCFNIGTGTNLLMEDITTESGDDGIGLNAAGYSNGVPSFGDVNGVTIRRWTDKLRTNEIYEPGQGGSGIIILTASWADWISGNTYQENDICINAGRIYQKVGVGDVVAANAPTHTSGSVEYADGITWLWKQDGTINHADVKNVLLEDCVWQSTRPFIRTAGSLVTGGTMRAFYPGTGAQSIVDNFVIDNITITPAATGLSLFLGDINIGTVEFKNLSYTLPVTDYLFRIVPREETFVIDNIIFNNCHIDLEGIARIISIPAPTYYYKINKISIINDSDIRTDDTTRVSLIQYSGVNMIDEIELKNSLFHHLIQLVQLVGLDGLELNITAENCTFDETCERLIWLYNTINSTVYFDATNCSFEETTLAMFENNTASSSIIVTSTGSTGESIPNLNTANVDVTGSDLVPILGDNIIKNGKFRENVNNWVIVNGVLTWEADGSCKFTANGSNPAGMYQSVNNPLSDYVRLTFKAKSPTLTVTMKSNYNPNLLNPVTNPAMTTEWQTYKFEGARGASAGGIYLLSNTNLSNGDIIYFDDITVIQYEP